MRLPPLVGGRSWSIHVPVANRDTGIAESSVTKLARVPESVHADQYRGRVIGKAFAEDTAYLRSVVNTLVQAPAQPLADPPRLPRIGGGSWSIHVPVANRDTGIAESSVTKLALAPESVQADPYRARPVGKAFAEDTTYLRAAVNALALAPIQPPPDPSLDSAERPWKGPFF